MVERDVADRDAALRVAQRAMMTYVNRVLRISRKGGRDALEPLSPPVERALDDYLDGRSTGILFGDDQGRRIYEAQAWRLVRRLARNAA